MTTVTLTPITWAQVRIGMTVMFRGRPAKVKHIGTTSGGHRRVTINGYTRTMRAVEQTALVEDAR